MAESAGTKLFVNNLAWDIDHVQLQEYMSQSGAITRADVTRDNHGRSKGWGIVEYASAESARHAIETLNGTSLHDRTIFIREDREANVKSKKVYIGNLAWDVELQELKDFMKQAGEVHNVDILKDNLGRSKGCAIVEFGSFENAVHAMKTLNNVEFRGRMIFCREDRENPEATAARGERAERRPRVERSEAAGVSASSSSEPTERVALHIGNIVGETTWQEIKDLCKPFVTPVHVDVFGNHACVEVASRDEVSRGIGAMRGLSFNGGDLTVREWNAEDDGGHEAGGRRGRGRGRRGRGRGRGGRRFDDEEGGHHDGGEEGRGRGRGRRRRQHEDGGDGI